MGAADEIPPLRDPPIESAFIRAALAATTRADEAASRLIYADWLDERNDLRADYLRLKVDFDDPKKFTEPDEREALESKLRELEAKLSPHWLTMVDAVDKFTVLWPYAQLRAFVANSPAPIRPLNFVADRGNQETNFLAMKISRGHYIYPLYVHDKKLHVVARMRVTGYVDAAGSPPEPFPLINEGWLRFLTVPHPLPRSRGLEGERGSPVRMDNVVPRGVLERMRFRSRRGERGLKYLVDGELLRSLSVQGVYRLTRETAFDLDCLIAGVDPG